MDIPANTINYLFLPAFVGVAEVRLSIPNLRRASVRRSDEDVICKDKMSYHFACVWVHRIKQQIIRALSEHIPCVSVHFVVYTTQMDAVIEPVLEQLVRTCCEHLQ